MPFVARKVAQLLSDDRADAQKLAALIESDQGIAAMLLRLASSTAFGASKPLQGLTQAITRIGFNETRNVVMALATKSMFKKPGMVERRLWEHSLGVGIATRILAERYAAAHVDGAFLAGQMHDVGMIIVHNKNTLYSQMPFYAPSSVISASEQKELGYTHHDVGALVVSSWQLSSQVEAAVLYHDDLDLAEIVVPESMDLVCAVVVADYVCHSQSKAAVVSEDNLPQHVQNALERLGIRSYSKLAIELFDTVMRERTKVG